MLKIWCGYIYTTVKSFYRLRTDNNIDNTSGVIEEWINNVKQFYHKIDYKNTSQYNITDASTPYEWSNLHYSNVILLRQEALDKAREVWADYLMVRCEIMYRHIIPSHNHHWNFISRYIN